MSFWRPDIEEVFDYYHANILRGSGNWRKACCPLNSHEDMSPSASVNLEAGKWNCFSCDMRGDGLDIVAHNEGTTTFNETVARARELFKGGEESRPKVGARPGRKGKNWQPPWGRI